MLGSAVPQSSRFPAAPLPLPVPSIPAGHGQCWITRPGLRCWQRQGLGQAAPPPRGDSAARTPHLGASPSLWNAGQPRLPPGCRGECSLARGTPARAQLLQERLLLIIFLISPNHSRLFHSLLPPPELLAENINKAKPEEERRNKNKTPQAEGGVFCQSKIQ